MKKTYTIILIILGTIIALSVAFILVYYYIVIPNQQSQEAERIEREEAEKEKNKVELTNCLDLAIKRYNTYLANNCSYVGEETITIGEEDKTKMFEKPSAFDELKSQDTTQTQVVKRYSCSNTQEYEQRKKEYNDEKNDCYNRYPQ